MPFNINLRKSQNTKQWTFEKNKETEILQQLLNEGKRTEYGEQLLAYVKKGHQFTRTKGIVYELIDNNEPIEVPIKFKVKNSVITWEFVAPMDVTHQSFRDRVFNTAAKAHACVDNSCETYYRGTDHLHLMRMHTWAGESSFNHNHYRTGNDGPITPVEVYQHLMAFYAQAEGRAFISSEDERNDIILKFSVYWANFNADIKYVALSLMKGEGGVNQLVSQLKNIAMTGTLNPEQAAVELDRFFASEHGKNIFKLAEKNGLTNEQLDDVKLFIKKTYSDLYPSYAPQLDVAISEDETLEPTKSISPGGSPRSNSGSKKSSPRDEYLTAPDQTPDEIDKLEWDAFASDLTKHCQSINKQLLDDLALEDFRKGLMLYHALRTAQQELGLKPEEGKRFHPNFISDKTDALIQEMILQLPNLQVGSTEEQLGSPLLEKLLNWVKNAPPELDKWVDWVKVNGSRGLGSEIAGVRDPKGKVDLNQAVPQGDRKPGDNIAEIDFKKVELKTIFFPARSVAPETEIKGTVFSEESVFSSKEPIFSEHGIKTKRTIFSDNNNDPVAQTEYLKQRLLAQLKQLTDNQRTEHKLDKDVFKAKTGIILLALKVLSNKEDVRDLLDMAKQTKEWRVTAPGLKSRLEATLLSVILLKGEHQVALANEISIV